ncbi:hypothetical protein Q4I28_004604 [Leishmania naiffi]|uniref:Uncharacterized protein n=1 Tax=Leishmania naiffi TaxID=5678 RepID=A0AAW3BPY5_9TRYP
MGSTNIMCDFFYVDAVSPHRQRNVRPHFAPLSQTWVKPELLENSTATFLDSILYTDCNGTAAAQMWLRVDSDHYRQLGAALSVSSLVAACRVPLVCPSRADVPIIGGAAVLVDDASPVAGQFHLIYPCVSSTDTSLREVVHSWNGVQLSVTRKRALLSVAGTTPPYAATVVVNEAATAGVFVLEWGAYHRADAFHVRTDAAVRQGLVAPVTVLQMRAPLVEGETTPRSLRHGCLTESLVGFIVHEPYRQRFIFSLASIPSADAHVSCGEMQIVLEMSTATPYDADEALVPCCGLAQRLVYTGCALTRTHLYASPLLEVTQVVLSVHVEGALSRPSPLSPMSNVTWRLCGSQRYEATVIRLQRPLEERPSWVVGPLRAVSSNQPCVGSTLDHAGSVATLARGSSDAESRSQMRRVTCAVEEHFSTFSRPEGGAVGGVSHRCSLTPSAGAIYSTYSHRPQIVGTMHESRSCRRMAATWWQSPPLWLSRTACRITNYSLFELSALYALIVIVCFFAHLLLRGRGRGDGRGVLFTRPAIA